VKIATLGLDIAPGKQKYVTEAFRSLVKQSTPKKETPYAVEFVGEDFEHCDAFVYEKGKKLDLALIDLEKIEARLGRTADQTERALLAKVQAELEAENLPCDGSWSEEDKKTLRGLMLVTIKPCVAADPSSPVDALVSAAKEKAGVLLFYTAGEKEVHAWDIKKGDTVLVAAGRIHSDLARGFIRAEVINAKSLAGFHNMNEARSRGAVATVERDYIMQEGDVIEVKFSV